MQRGGGIRPAAAALALVLLSAAVPHAALAQIEGRWAMLLGGRPVGPLRGELRLTTERGRPGGTIWLQNSDAPVTLSNVEQRNGRISFSATADGRLRFTGELRGTQLRGIAVADSGPPRPWTAAPISPSVEYYPVLPRFSLRQVIAGRGGDEVRLPGAWVAAARAIAEDSSYAVLARAAGVTPLGGDALRTVAPLRALGLARRSEMVAASRRTLEAIRAQLPTPAMTVAFDRTFRARGAWITDLHDAAVVQVRAGTPSFDPALTIPALAGAGWLARSDSGPEAVSIALYRLHMLESADSVAAQSVREAMLQSSPRSAAAVALMLRGYAAAERWHAEALRFLLFEPWIGGRTAARSVADLVREDWRGVTDSLPIPVITSRRFGYPQAVPRYGVPDVLFNRLVEPENWSARQWLGRHGAVGLLESLQLMTVDLGDQALLESGGEVFRLTTVRRQSLESTNGLLEPADAILVDPGYAPLLALGAVIHEWQHLAAERVRRSAIRAGSTIHMPAPHPFVAEGIAEWQTERILATLALAFPLLALHEPEKRARLRAGSDAEQHALGHAMVRALAAAVPERARLTALLFEALADPAAVPRASELRRAWARFGGPELVVSAPSLRVLIPETSFTIEDGFPDVVATRIRIGD